MTTRRPRPLWSCAREELILAVRTRLLLIFAAVFGVLALVVASSGYVLTGGTGLQDFSRTAASLLELVLLVVPLASLVIGVTALTPDAGSAELLYSQPIARRTILAGKVIGLWLALVAAAITGGATSRRRARSLATALALWFAAVVLFDVAVLGIASWLPSGPASRVLIISAMVNPVDAVRTATLMALEGTTAFGAASLAFLRFTRGAAGAVWWLGASALIWIIAPIAVGAWRVSRADIS